MKFLKKRSHGLLSALLTALNRNPDDMFAAQAPAHTQGDPVWQDKVHLAAALRLAVLHDFDEGIDNHFTVAVPGREDQYLISPFGVHWSEASASAMKVFKEAGETLEGTGVVELSASPWPATTSSNTPSTAQTWKCTCSFRLEPKRWMKATAPMCSAAM
jgi:hypothetical protein